MSFHLTRKCASRASLLALLTGAGSAMLTTSPAAAATYQHCYNNMQVNYSCPDRNYGVNQRHTYKNARTSWTTSITYSCAVRVTIGAHLAYDSGAVNGSPKYYGTNCGYVRIDFPNNTQLLKNFSSFYDAGGTQFLVGRGDY